MLRIKQFVLPVLVLGLLVAGAVAQASPDIQHWQTANGARVYYVHAPELPMVDVRVVFDAGSARDGERAGLAALTNSLLDEGVPGLGVNEIAETFESVGASYGADALRDMAVASLRSLTEPAALDTALPLFARVLAEPEFPQKSFERNRKAMLIGLQHEQQSPGAIVEKQFYKRVYGAHPYAIPGNGTLESVTALSREDVIGFHEKYYVAHNAVIAIVGAVERQQAESIAEQLTKNLRKGERAASLPATTPLDKAITHHIEHPATQSHIRIGQPGMKRGDQDYFALYVGNHMLGGSGLVSRLSNEVREKRGLSYSVYSYFLPMRENGPFMLGLQTKNEQVAEARKVVMDTLRRYIKEGPSKKELKRSKQNITGGFALRIDSNKKIVEYVAMIGFYGLPLDYLDTFNDKVEAVTAKQIRDAFRRRVDPDKLVTVIVGGQK
jgi:zinc protease